MNLFNQFKDLVKDSLLCKSYKGMTAAKRVLCIIALAPFIAVYVAMLLAYWMLAVCYRFACNQLEYVHAFIIKERAEVRHATEAVVYAIAFPWIFLMKLISSILSFALMIVHFFTSMIGYVATFGGIKFSPFILDNVDRFKSREAVKHSKALVTFIIIALTLLVLAIFLAPIVGEAYDSWVEEILLTVENVDEYTIEYNAAMFHARLSTIDAMIKLAYTMFVLIYVPIYSNCGPRKKYITNLSAETKDAE